MQLTTLAMIRFLREAAEGNLRRYTARLAHLRTPRHLRNVVRINGDLGRALAGVLALTA